MRSKDWKVAGWKTFDVYRENLVKYHKTVSKADICNPLRYLRLKW